MRLPPLPPRLVALGARLFRPAIPSVAVEIAEEHVAFVRASGRSGRTAIGAYFVASVAPGAVRTSPLQPNVAEPALLEPLLRAGRDRVSPGGGPVALVLPDGVARAALVPVDSVPSRREELREMLAWRLKKTLPFKVEEALMDSQAFDAESGQVLLACAARRKVITEHEALLESLGFQVGSVTLSTLALASRLPSDTQGDVLLLNVGSGWFSTLIARQGRPIFYRCKLLPEGERRGAQRNWFVGGELVPTLEYHRTRLGGDGIKRGLLHVSGPGWEALADELGETIDLPVERVGAHDPSVPSEAAERLGPAWSQAARAIDLRLGSSHAAGSSAA